MHSLIFKTVLYDNRGSPSFHSQMEISKSTLSRGFSSHQQHFKGSRQWMGINYEQLSSFKTLWILVKQVHLNSKTINPHTPMWANRLSCRNYYWSFAICILSHYITNKYKYPSGTFIWENSFENHLKEPTSLTVLAKETSQKNEKLK